MKTEIRAKITASTQDHLEIKDVVDELVISKSGTVSLVLQTTAVNFDLLSEYEQDNKIYAFAGLLNSLNFHLQILIRTKRIDISRYVNYLKNQSSKTMSVGLKKQLEIYTQFIQNLIVQNDVLDKKFYIVIPFNNAGITINPSVFVGGVTKKKDEDKKVQSSYDLEKLLEQAKIFLYPKRDQVLKLLARMGLMGHQLTNNELIELFYDMYNPED